MSELKKSSNRFLELDVFRGLAALSVVFFHYTTGYTWRYNPPDGSMLFQFPLGRFGVHLFFMISGFVVFMTLEKSSRALDFIVSRFSRLYPAYWGAIFLTYLVIQKCLLIPSRQMEVSFQTILINLSMLQNWFHVADLDTVYWTLAVELLFYSLIFVAFLSKTMKYIELYGFLWLLLMVLNKYFIPTWPVLVFLKFIFSWLLKYGNLFFAGILFYKLKTKGSAWYRHAGIGLCFLVQYLIWKDLEREAILPSLVFFLLFYLFIYGRLSFIVKKPLIFLGTISYSLYLIHQNIGYIIIQWLFFFNLNSGLRFVIPILCSLMLATAMTYCIEKPTMNFVRQTYRNWKTR